MSISLNIVLQQFNNGAINGKNFKQIADFFAVTDKKGKNGLRLVLESLARAKKIYLTPNQCYELKGKKSKKSHALSTEKQTDLLCGTVRVNERGFGFLTVDGFDADFFIPARKMADALNGDTVFARPLSASPNSDEVEVIKVLKRGVTKLCGTLYRDSKVLFVRPDDRGYLYDVILQSSADAKIGDKVFIEITSFPKGGNPQGKILQVLGESETLLAEESASVITAQIKEEFDEQTLAEAQDMEQKVGDNELIARLDLRNKLIFTIDGETARDFDDAVSLEILDNGNYLLGVHIADVSNYVTEGSNLENEAFERATSVYLPDRVIPMLPFQLSNGICSLNQGVDRLTLSVISQLTPNGEVVESKFYQSVINSKCRLTYTKAQQILDGDESVIEEYKFLVPTLLNMQKLKNVMEKNRLARGEIDLCVKEADVFLIDGKVQVSLHKSNDATKLIEQFMIFANEQVAEYLTKLGVPCVYRVHDRPSEEKVAQFKAFLQSLGIRHELSGEKPVEYKLLLDKLRGQKVFDTVNKMMLRSMQKAEYRAENVGHFGLASECYVHFTSPIRRYPDLVCHRVLKGVLNGKKGQLIDLYGDFVAKASEQSSRKEKNATLCEREVDDLYKVLYMKEFIGEEFVGTISGVTNFGVFVELDNCVEGLIRIESLPKRNYHFNQDRMSLECGKFTLSLGDRVKVGVLDANVSTRKIEFVFIQK